MMIITSRTPPSVAHAKIEAEQEAKQVRFLNAMVKLIEASHKAGLELSRVARAMEQVGKAVGKFVPPETRPTVKSEPKS